MDPGGAGCDRNLLFHRVSGLLRRALCVIGVMNPNSSPSYRMGDYALELTHEMGNKPPIIITKGETVMGTTGKKDKGSKEQRKKPKLNIKEKRKQKNEKKNK